MTDDYFSSLLIIAMEKDIADKTSNEQIVQRFAALSSHTSLFTVTGRQKFKQQMK